MFIRSLEETGFSNPEWPIMFISVLSVKLKISMYTGIHKIML